MRIGTIFFVLSYILFSVFYSQTLRASEKDIYRFDWLDKDKYVFVLQNKAHPKKGTWSLAAGFLKGIEGDYQNTYGLELSSSYFFSEEWGVEIVFRTYQNWENNAFELLKGINGVTPFIRKEKNLVGALALWSPFYGKINTFNKIFYFDWYFASGLGSLETESNHESFKNPGGGVSFFSEKYLTLLGKTGVKFYLNEKMDFRVEYFQKVFIAPTGLSSKDARFKSDLTFSIGFNF